jgi:hypothetical protein
MWNPQCVFVLRPHGDSWRKNRTIASRCERGGQWPDGAVPDLARNDYEALGWRSLDVAERSPSTAWASQRRR